jgi:hypothetical protein
MEMREEKREMGSTESPISPFSFPVSLPDEVHEVATSLIERLGDNLAALIWHGSWARGEQTSESDHDLIVILKDIDDEMLHRISEVFAGRKAWSTYVKTQEELRQYPSTGRLQFHHGAVVLYGKFEAPPVTKEGLLEELRRLATDIQHEARYRIIHGNTRDHRALAAEFFRVRNARGLYYQAKLTLLAFKSREVLFGAPYPATRADLRERLTDPDDLAMIDVIENWGTVKSQYEQDFTPLAYLLDRVGRNLVHQLDLMYRQ